MTRRQTRDRLASLQFGEVPSYHTRVLFSLKSAPSLALPYPSGVFHMNFKPLSRFHLCWLYGRRVSRTDLPDVSFLTPRVHEIGSKAASHRAIDNKKSYSFVLDVAWATKCGNRSDCTQECKTSYMRIVLEGHEKHI